MDKIINRGLPSVKPRVMFCTTHWRTGGMERKIANLFRGLIGLFDIYLLIVGDKKSVIEIPEDVNEIVMTQEEFNESYSDRALHHIMENNIDIVVGVTNLFYGQLDLYEKCHNNEIKTIAANSEYFFYPYHSEYFFDIVNRRQEVFRYVDAVLWQTNFSAAAYSLVNDNGYVMPNPNTFKKQAQISKKNKKVIICVGRFNDYIKRIDRVMECFSAILKKEPKAKLWIVGPCDRKLKIEKLGGKSINEMMEDLCLDDGQITFFGEISDVEKCYKEASVLLLTSENEGFGNVINEAASFGVPIVCNEIPGIEDLVKEGHNGFIVAQDDIEKLADSICKILSNKKLRDKLGLNAFNYVDKFSLDKIIKKWGKLINVVNKSTNAADIKDGLRLGLGYGINNSLESYINISKDLHNTCVSLFDNITNINSDLIIARNQLDDLKKINLHLSKELRDINARYSKVIDSKSWRLTEPIRNIKSLINKGRSK